MRVRGEIASQRHWQSVIEWVGPDCAVGLTEVTAVDSTAKISGGPTSL